MKHKFIAQKGRRHGMGGEAKQAKTIGEDGIGGNRNIHLMGDWIASCLAMTFCGRLDCFVPRNDGKTVKRQFEMHPVRGENLFCKKNVRTFVRTLNE